MALPRHAPGGHTTTTTTMSWRHRAGTNTMRVLLHAITTTHTAHKAMKPRRPPILLASSPRTLTDGSLYFLVTNVLHCIRILLQIKLYVIF